jgi:2-keto-3-deoxy-L-rhamnonate aldolase RhmA
MRGRTTIGWRRARREFPISSDFGEAFRLTLLTADPAMAEAGDRAGIQRIGIDFEHLGKAERQAGYDTRLSRHGWSDLAAVAVVLRRAGAFARLNALHDGSAEEVERALSCGAHVLMLPFFRAASEVERFVALVRGRAEVMALVETAPAAVRIREIAAVRGVDEIMIGLNDLRLQLGIANHFELLASPMLEGICSALRADGRPFSLAGVARSGDTAMPVPSELVYAQYPRLGATGGWVTRSFMKGLAAGELPAVIAALRRELSDWAAKDAAALEAARAELAHRAAAWR